MQIIADESIDFGLITLLRIKKLEVITAHEKFRGFLDSKILSEANLQNCFLITEDKDFGELVYRLKLEHKGILLIRLGELPRPLRISYACEMIEKYIEQLTDNFSVLTPNGLRISKKNK